MHTIERYHDMSCGHRVCGHEGKCSNLHGHNYRVTFVCAAEEAGTSRPEDDLDDVGRVIDFDVVKTRLCQWLEDNWDHKFLCFEHDQLMLHAYNNAPYHFHTLFHESLVWVPFNPTAERMAQYLVEVLGPQQLDGTGVQVIACKVEETRKCSATFFIDA
jgi:6-pyruvoyltetrahydropterin/6-carboxytetrahydropterin synthase